MLQWEWPTVWDVDSRETIRVGLEKAIRSAMAKSPSTQIRGIVTVDLPQLGSTPPRLVLNGIRELSLERTALMLHFSYTGDFSVALRGLQINLDTVSGGDVEEMDSHLATPFFCPFEMTLQSIVLDGMASIEITQDVVRRAEGGHPAFITNPNPSPSPNAALCCITAGAPPEMTYNATLQNVAGQSISLWRGESRPHLEGAVAGGAGTAFSAMHPAAMSVATNSVVTPASDACVSSSSLRTSRPAAGYGVLLTAGGRRRMRRPAAQSGNTDMHASLTDPHPHLTKDTLSANKGGATPAASHAHGSGERTTRLQDKVTTADLLLGQAVVRRRQLKVQLFGDPLKSFTVVSNFGAVPGVNKRVEETLKSLIRPAIERVMAEGVSFAV